MATLSRKFLSSLGIDEDKSDMIIETYQEVLAEIKAERDNYKEAADSVPELNKQIEELKAQATSGDELETIKAELENVKNEYKSFKDGITAKETTAKKENAYKALLKAAGVSEKRFDSIMRVTDLNDFEIDENGNPADGDKFVEAIKSEWGDFIPTTHTEGAATNNPPANNGRTTMTKEQIRAIPDAVSRQKAMLENASLFGLSNVEE